MGHESATGVPNGVDNSLLATCGLDMPVVQNLTQNPLCRLPDNILLQIMDRVDKPGIFCFRRTSRIFMRLFGDQRFQAFHQDSESDYFPDNVPTPWQREPVPKAVQPCLRELLQRDIYCQMCRGARQEMEKKLGSDMLYCSGCKMEHPTGLFSYKHRRKVPDERRICIGREGFVRICKHRVVRLDEIEGFLASGKCEEAEFCDDPSHYYSGVGPECGSNDAPVVFGLCDSFSPGYYCHYQHGHRPTLLIEWGTHITVPGVGSTNGVDGDELLRRLNWYWQNGASSVVTDKPWKFPPELRAFYSKSCSCIKLRASRDEARNAGPQCPKHGLAISGDEWRTFDDSLKIANRR